MLKKLSLSLNKNIIIMIIIIKRRLLSEHNKTNKYEKMLKLMRQITRIIKTKAQHINKQETAVKKNKTTKQNKTKLKAKRQKRHQN